MTGAPSSAFDDAPLISVVIPTYGRPELLIRRALRSALSQSHPHVEVLVVLDGDDPATCAALDDLDERVRVLTLPVKQGVSAARNHGVEHSRGEWVAFLDDDDEWQPDKLARQLAAAQASRYALPVVFSGYIERWPHGDRLRPGRPRARDERIGDYMLVRGSPRGQPCALICSLFFAPRALALRVPFTPGLRSQEDWDWLLRAEQYPGVGFEQVPPEPGNLAIYYFGEPRPSGSRHLVWEEHLGWAEEQRRAGRLSERAFAGFILTQLAPRAAAAGDVRGLPVLGRALLGSRPSAVELARFLRHFLIPVSWRRSARSWLNARRSGARLGG